MFCGGEFTSSGRGTMRLGHEKARRRELGRSRYDPISSFRPNKSRGSRPPRPRPPKVLWCVVLDLNAKACWKKVAREDWRCVQADRPLHWMVELSPAQAKAQLQQSGACFCWLRPDQISRSVTNSEPIRYGAMTQHVASPPVTERSPASATMRQGMVVSEHLGTSPVLPTGSRTSFNPTSNLSLCPLKGGSLNAKEPTASGSGR